MKRPLSSKHSLPFIYCNRSNRVLTFIRGICLTFFLCTFVGINPSFSQTVNITVDTSKTFQKIEGWGATIALKHLNNDVLKVVLKREVNDLGLNSIRNEIERREWEDVFNDNSNPDVAIPGYFQAASVDSDAVRLLLPMKQLLQTKGEKLIIYVSSSFFRGGSTGDIPAWLLESPAEMAEWLITYLKRLKNIHNIDVDYVCIANEPGNNNAFTPTIVGKMIKIVGPKLTASGLNTKIMFPESIDVDDANTYINPWLNDPEIWKHTTCLSYHLYNGTQLKSSSKTTLYNSAISKGAITAQTEYMGINLNILMDDIINGGVSNWYLYNNPDIMSINNSGTTLAMNNTYWKIRQIMRFAKQGSFRTGATSSNTASVSTVAFKQNGKVNLVCYNYANPGSYTLNISGLPAGSYAVNNETSELGVFTVTTGGALTIPLASGTALTVYPHVGNMPPVITNFIASNGYLNPATSNTNLNSSAIDPENNSLSYTWSIVSKPAGATVSIANPATANTSVSGLTIAGKYMFRISVTDGANIVSEDLLPVIKTSSNMPPVILGTHNRNPVIIRLPIDSTQLRVGAIDNEGNTLTYSWTIVSQPAGANAIIRTPTTANTIIAKLNVAGVYTVKITVSDGTTSVFQDYSFTVFPANVAPVFLSAIATPTITNTAMAATSLSALASDANGDTLTYWWTVTSAPNGASTQFGNQGNRNTSATGLTVAGTYVFTIAAIDVAIKALRTVTVTVTAAAQYTLTVANGSGSGNYVAGYTVTITANPPPLNYVFDKWTGDVANVSNVSSATTTLTMPSSATTLTATYKLATGMIQKRNNPVELILYPNPTTNKLTIEYETGINEIYIYDLLGKESAYYRIDSKRTEVNLPGLRPGVYFIHIYSKDGKVLVKKVMKW